MVPEDDDAIYNQPVELDDVKTPHGRSSAPRRKAGKKLLVTLVVIVVLAGLSFMGYKLLFKNKNEVVPTNTVASGATSTESQAVDDVPEASLTETLTSSPNRITLKYPKTWKASETNDNGIRVDSVAFTYKTKDGKSVNGNFRVYIRKGARDQDGLYIGKAVAIEPSAKLAYKNPTPTQRKETNLSLFGLKEPTNFALFMITGNYDLKKGDTLGPKYGKEIETIIIAGGFSSPDKKDDLDMNEVPQDWFKTTNAYKQAIEIVQSLELT